MGIDNWVESGLSHVEEGTDVRCTSIDGLGKAESKLKQLIFISVQAFLVAMSGLP